MRSPSSPAAFSRCLFSLFSPSGMACWILALAALGVCASRMRLGSSRWALSLDALTAFSQCLLPPDFLAGFSRWTHSLIHSLSTLAGFSRWLLSLDSVAGCTRRIHSLAAFAGFTHWLLSPDSVAGCSRRILLLAALAGFTRWMQSLDSLAGCSCRILSLAALAGFSRWLLLRD
jgi:hypothetical protein